MRTLPTRAARCVCLEKKHNMLFSPIKYVFINHNGSLVYPYSISSLYRNTVDCPVMCVSTLYGCDVTADGNDHCSTVT